MISLFLLAITSADDTASTFAFKEFRGDGVYSELSLRKAGCKEGASRTFYCSRSDTVAERWAFIQYKIYRQRLVFMQVSGLRNSIPDVLPQLRSKYGKPCDVGTEEVNNRLGARFSSERVTWCFSTGNLVYRERDATTDSYSLTYTSFVQPPAESREPSDF